jgi:hypothetical protein
MEQFLDQKDNKWHITMWVIVPVVNVRHSYNFRAHSIVNNDSSVIRDPVISNSNYIFALGTKFFNKKVFFNASFDPLEIQNIKSFKFGFCNEQVAWLNNTFVVVENNCPKITNNNAVIEEEVLEVKILDIIEEPELINIKIPESLNESELASIEMVVSSSPMLDDILTEQKVEVPLVEPKDEPLIQQKDIVHVAKKRFGRKKK